MSQNKFQAFQGFKEPWETWYKQTWQIENKVLWVTIDEILSWKPYINVVTWKVSKFDDILLKARHIFMKNICFAILGFCLLSHTFLRVRANNTTQAYNTSQCNKLWQLQPDPKAQNSEVQDLPCHQISNMLCLTHKFDNAL